jgi:hypothetical protein
MKNLCCGQKALIIGGIIGAYFLYKKKRAGVGNYYNIDILTAFGLKGILENSKPVVKINKNTGGRESVTEFANSNKGLVKNKEVMEIKINRTNDHFRFIKFKNQLISILDLNQIIKTELRKK